MKKLLFSLLLVFACNVVAMDVEEEDCFIVKPDKIFSFVHKLPEILNICEHIFTSKTSIPQNVGIIDEQFELLEKLYKYWLGYYAHRHILYHKDLSNEIFCDDRMIDFITKNYGDGDCITNLNGLCFEREEESLISEEVLGAYDYFLDSSYGEIFQYLDKVGHLPVELVDIIKQYLCQEEYNIGKIKIPKWIVNCFVKRELWNRECRSWSSTRVYKDGQYILFDGSTLSFACYHEDDFLHQLLVDVPTKDLDWSVNGMPIGSSGWWLGDGTISISGYAKNTLPIVQLVLKQHLNEIRLLSLSNFAQNCNNELIKSFLPMHNDDCAILGIVSLAGLGVLGNLVWYKYQGKVKFIFCA